MCSRLPLALLLLGLMAVTPRAQAAADKHAPEWMHALASVPLPPDDDKTDAVLLLSDESVSVISETRILRHVRVAYKILRPSGREYGQLFAEYSPRSTVTSMTGWCIPAHGKDYEVTGMDAIETSDIQDIDLYTDIKLKVLDVPAPEPGNVVGFEYDLAETPIELQDIWMVQDERSSDHRINPAIEKRFTVSLPPGWTYKASWHNYPAAEPVRIGTSTYQWTVRNIPGIEFQHAMPPFRSLIGTMVVSFIPPSGPTAANYSNWKEMGDWYQNILRGRRDPSPAIQQKVAVIVAGKTTKLEQMRAIADFVQAEIRYVEISLGIGGWQPHPASEVFTHRYGDCKDKSALMAAMLSVIGIDSYHLLIDSQPGAVTPDMPAHHAFDHAILAIRLPEDVILPATAPIYRHPRLGRLLIFDPTDEITPLGQLPDYLTASWALLVTPQGGELIQTPRPPAAINGVQRTGKFVLDASGSLQGDVVDSRLGERATELRYRLRSAKDADRIKPVELLLSNSLSYFHITRASIINLHEYQLPFELHYSFVAGNYAKTAGDLILLRPRVLGTKSSPVLEDKEPRQFPVMLGPSHQDTDTFEIVLPPGYQVDDLPPEVKSDFGFASYRSKSEVVVVAGQPTVLRYTRTFETRELLVPLNGIEQLRRFYRIISADERNVAVLKRSTSPAVPTAALVSSPNGAER